MKTLQKFILMVSAGISFSALAGCYETDYYVNPYPATPPVIVSDYPSSGAHYGPPMPPSAAYYGPQAPQQIPPAPPSGAHYGPPVPQPMLPQSSAHYGTPTPPPTPPVTESYGSSNAHYGPAAQQVPVAASTATGVIPVVRTSDMKKNMSVEKHPVVMTDKTNSAKANDLPDVK